MNRATEQVRLEYLPTNGINVLFIAEAPPADPERFFYFDQVHRHDWLYLALMRLIFADARDLAVKDLRKQKPDYLARFRDRGYYLIDASDQPLTARATDAAKQAALRSSLDELVGKVRRLATPSTRIVLISKAVHSVCSDRLKAEGFKVINAEVIDFPSTGRQKHFARKLRRDLAASDEFLQSTIRGLEAAIEFFSAGEQKKRERERWIVEHFLLGLGVEFDAAEIEQPDRDPPDARFRGASFELKEIQQPGRRRGDEFREALKRAKAAISHHELTEGFSPQSMHVGEAYRLVMTQTRELAARRYVNPADRRSLDLLFYLNLSMEVAWDIEEGTRPDISAMIAQGWRSVSFLHGGSTVCILHASAAAPEFLKSAVGKLIAREPF